MKQIIALTTFLLLLFGCGNGETAEEEITDELSVAEVAIAESNQERTEEMENEEYRLNDYKEILRNPETYENRNTVFFGTVLQIINETEDYNEYLISVGSYSPPAIIYAVVEKDNVSDRLIERDEISLYGRPVSEVTYETTGGDDSTVPLVYVDFYSINNQ